MLLALKRFMGSNWLAGAMPVASDYDQPVGAGQMPTVLRAHRNLAPCLINRTTHANRIRERLRDFRSAADPVPPLLVVLEGTHDDMLDRFVARFGELELKSLLT